MNITIPINELRAFLNRSWIAGGGCQLSDKEISLLLAYIEQLEFEIESLESIIDGRDYEDNKRPTPSLQ